MYPFKTIQQPSTSVYIYESKVMRRDITLSVALMGIQQVVHLVVPRELLSGTKLVDLLVVEMENWLVVHSGILRDDE